MDSYIIQIKSQDELTLLIDKIVSTEAQRVYLLIPENSRIAQHALNFRLLKREADALGKEIVIVSANPRVQALALKSSIQVHHETEEFKLGAREKNNSNAEAQPKRVGDITPPPASQFIKGTEIGEAGQGERGVAEVSVSSSNKKDSASFGGKEDAGNNLAERRVKTPNEAITKKLFLLPSLGSVKLLLPKGNFRRDKSKPNAVPSGDLKIARLLDSRKKISRGIFSASKIKVFKAILGFLVLISGSITAFTFYSILPSSKIFVKPVSEDLSFELFIKGDANISEINEKNLTIPSQIFEKTEEVSKVVKSSGEKEIKERARGRIRVYNSYSSEPQTLVKTTRFISEDGKIFRTTETIVVPGAKVEGGEIVGSSIFVNVEGSETGAEYNIGPSSFSIPGFKGTPKYLAFYGKSEESMSGGKIAKVKVITENDYNTVVSHIERDLKTQSTESLKSLIPAGFFVPDEAYEISDVSIISQSKIGDEAEAFSVLGRVSLKAFAILEKDAFDLLSNDFTSRFPAMRLSDNQAKMTFDVKSKDFKDGIIGITLSSNMEAFAVISVDEMKEKVIGKSEVDVRRVLSSYPGVKEAKVTFWPFWVNSIPDDPSRIEIIIE
ncbi:MAG: hypothetical protein A3B96_03480 [Candidatus Spechtbacteria bacterium RIFCSPHIGHO2_02_FULL_43_15b]|uniref:Baseplate protein J-like domain-containing protein n=1 Tax=Candidatus Spechtbacteria bacterium RIFCSPHIGHO2_01_FULL_43_30 TaxID=1802158 RepID=A0A1G2H7L4_9BACT|nr:MAG: hypothetical protein A2827_02365 [Candidatus Spechtbacteria bacterium RIFCSPHIGHO2_01_FULL_43_30]OGZ59410.1 MAG: hypothetical protein A3B96_03480 [Candidatus Spechtbacteria bacterium RIFCSPHIGHO2_02_FULL_43_15b]